MVWQFFKIGFHKPHSVLIDPKNAAWIIPRRSARSTSDPLGGCPGSMKMICCHVPSCILPPENGTERPGTEQRCPDMRVSIAITPLRLCAYSGILRRNPFEHTFEIGDQNGFVLDRCHRTCRTGRKYRGGDIPVWSGEAA
jgi:hypothetical protein